MKERFGLREDQVSLSLGLHGSVASVASCTVSLDVDHEESWSSGRATEFRSPRVATSQRCLEPFRSLYLLQVLMMYLDGDLPEEAPSQWNAFILNHP